MPRKKVEVVDETRNIALALKELCEDKGLPTSVVIDAMSEALKKAYFKYSDDYPDTVIKVDMDLDTGSLKLKTLLKKSLMMFLKQILKKLMKKLEFTIMLVM